MAQGGHAVAHQANILGGAHKGDGDGVHPVLKRKFQVFGVFFGQRGNAHRNPRQVDPLVFAQQAAVDDLADHVVALHRMNAQLDQPIGEQNARALFDVFRQGFEGGSYQRGRTRNLARRNRQLPAGLQQHGMMILQLRGANLWPLQVAQDAQRLALLVAHLADHLDQRQLFLVGAVGKVQADHIDARADQIAEDWFGVGGRSQRGDNLGAALGEGFDQVLFFKGHGFAPGKVRSRSPIYAPRFYAPCSRVSAPCSVALASMTRKVSFRKGARRKSRSAALYSAHGDWRTATVSKKD
jgi:hypothetical protein